MEHLAPLATINGANGCSIVANGDSVSGANGNHNHHWRPLAPFKWRHLIQSMAILRSQSPFRVSGSFGDPMAPIDQVAPLTTMAIVIAIGATHQIAIGNNGASIGAIYCRHWRQWRQMLHSPSYLTLLPKRGYLEDLGSFSRDPPY